MPSLGTSFHSLSEKNNIKSSWEDTTH